jgi:uncharacterized integral membrane protein (TIGR00697 family)
MAISELVKQSAQTTPANNANIMVVAMLFSAFLILSNLAGFKLAAIASLSFPAGLVFFPLTYVFDDILTEVYGFAASRRIIWMALLANVIIFLGMWVTTFLPPSAFWRYQTEYQIIYQGVPRIFMASMLSYLFGEFANAVILAKMKIRTAGRHLWLRAILSSAVGVLIDTVIFIHIAFLFAVPYIGLWKMIATMYLFKLIYEICATPITYQVAKYLKSKDNIDYYDVETDFNPFRLKL